MEPPGHVFEGYSYELEASDESYFMLFKDFADPCSEFISLFPGLSSGVELASIRSFRFKQNIYARAVDKLVKPALLAFIKAAEDFGCTKFYLAVPFDLCNFKNLLKMLAYIGFKQVPPDKQREICDVPAVLMLFELSQD